MPEATSPQTTLSVYRRRQDGAELRLPAVVADGPAVQCERRRQHDRAAGDRGADPEDVAHEAERRPAAPLAAEPKTFVIESTVARTRESSTFALSQVE